MKTIAINSNNDIYIDSSNNLAIKTDINAMGDILINKSQLNQGELLYDETKGIDFMGTIFNSPSNIDLYQSQLTDLIENSDEVIKLYSFETQITNTPKTQTLNYTAEILTEYGNITLYG